MRGTDTSARRVAVLYTIFGALWIIGSDTVVGWLTPEHWRLVHIGVAKGLLFVALSALIGYLALRRTAERERAALDEQQRAAAERERELLESIDEGFCTVDHQLRFLYVNNAAERILRRSAGELIGREFFQVFPDARDTRGGARALEALKSGLPFEHEAWYGPLGVWLQIRAYPSAAGLSVFFRDISARRSVEQELQRMAGLLETLLEQAPVGFAFLDRDLRFVRVNRQHTEIVGIPPDELIGRRLEDVIELPAGMDDLVQQVLLGGQPVSTSNRVVLPRRAQGEAVLAVSFYPVRMEAGTITGIGVVVQDVTERRAMHERLEQNLALLRATLDSTDDGIFVIGLDRAILAHNRRLREMFHLGEGFIAHHDSMAARRQVLPLVRDPVAFEAFAERMFQSPEAEGSDTIELLDGRIIERHTVPHRVGGAIVGRVWSHRDVTAQRRADHDLRESEARFRLMVEGSEQVFFYRHDRDGIFQYLSPSVRAVVGYEPEELLGRSSDLLIPSEEVRQTVRRRTRQALDAGVAAPAYTAVNRRRDGRLITLEITESPVVHDGSVVGVQGFARDVTERRRLEEELQQAHKMEAIGRLAGGVAHDFNNILTVITACVHVALEHELDPEVARVLAEIRAAADRASALTRQLLAFGRRQVVQPRAVDLNDVLVRAESMLGRVIGEDVVLRVTPSPEPVLAWADAGQVEQVVMNLAVNARDAMPHGGTLAISTARVSVAAPPEPIAAGDFVLLQVSDDGVGIARDVMPRIFEPFFTTKAFGAGTGLGLATVYAILTQTGGWVEAESTPGEGATFRAYFPLHAGAATPAPRAGAATSMPRGSERILVVEDESAVRNLLLRILSRLGYQVSVAADAGEALELVAGDAPPFDLILSDVVMPGLSGPELLQRCRSLSPGSRLALMSGYAADRIPSSPSGEPVYPVLEKPFEPALLAAVVRRLLDGNELALT